MIKSAYPQWIKPEFIPALDELVAKIGNIPVIKDDDRIVLGDGGSSDARIYIMPLNTGIMASCMADKKLFTQVNTTKDLAKSYMKHLQKEFNIPNATVVKMKTSMHPLSEVLGAIETLAKAWNASYLLVTNPIVSGPGFNLYFDKANALLQFGQPRHKTLY